MDREARFKRHQERALLKNRLAKAILDVINGTEPDYADLVWALATITTTFAADHIRAEEEHPS